MSGAADFSECGRYRYSLRRRWAEGGSPVCWIMLNPSTADADNDDPTIRRCIGFSKAWGYNALVVVNLFALRSTDPRALRTGFCDPVGPENDDAIAFWAEQAPLVVAAWGEHGRYGGREKHVRRIVGALHHLGLTKAGSPRHPLYLPARQQPIPWADAGRSHDPITGKSVTSG